jgi:hypothetical protein
MFIVPTTQEWRGDHLRVFGKAMTGGRELIRVDPDNREMQRVAEKVGVAVEFDDVDQLLTAVLDL